MNMKFPVSLQRNSEVCKQLNYIGYYIITLIIMSTYMALSWVCETSDITEQAIYIKYKLMIAFMECFIYQHEYVLMVNIRMYVSHFQLYLSRSLPVSFLYFA